MHVRRCGAFCSTLVTLGTSMPWSSAAISPDDGSPRGGYQDAARQGGALTHERGIPFVFATGNHDDRTSFATVLGFGSSLGRRH